MALFLEVTSRAAGRKWFAMGLNPRALSWDRTTQWRELYWWQPRLVVTETGEGSGVAGPFPHEFGSLGVTTSPLILLGRHGGSPCLYPAIAFHGS